MPFPYLFEENFEGGTLGSFDSESDTDSVLDFPHYTELARFPWPNYAPFRGAYVARWRLNGGTADATLTEGDVNISADATAGIRFAFYLAPDFTATADDTMNFIELQASATIELAVGFRITAATGAIEIGIGELTPTAFLTPTLQRGRWYQGQVYGDLDNGVGNDGSFTLNVEGATATVSTLDQGAITDAVVGFQLHLATTTGTVLLDSIVFETAAAGTSSRIYPIIDRYPLEMHLTKSGHVFVGPGQVLHVALATGAAADNTVTVYDTDRGNTNDAAKTPIYLANVTASELVDSATPPVQVTRGAYVVLAGTNPQARVSIGQAVAYGSGGAVKGYGTRRRVNPLEVM